MTGKILIYISIVAILLITFLITPHRKEKVWRERENPKFYIINACLSIILITLIWLLNILP